jgi:hypothetical protein
MHRAVVRQLELVSYQTELLKNLIRSKIFECQFGKGVIDHRALCIGL